MRAVVARDLADAQCRPLSGSPVRQRVQRRASTATMAIACARYRVTAKTGHHKVTVETITLRSAPRFSLRMAILRDLPA